MYDERLLMHGLEPETPPLMERTLTAMPHRCHMVEVEEYFIVVIHNNDSWTFRPVAVMVVRKAEISASGSFPISNQY